MSSLGDSKEQVRMTGLYGQVLFREAIDQCVSDWGQNKGEICQETVPSWIQSTALFRVVSVRRAKMGHYLEISSAASRFLGPCVLETSTSLADKLNICSFVLFWLSCWTANLNSFLSKLDTFLSRKHLSYLLCVLTSPQVCLFLYRGGVTW